MISSGPLESVPADAGTYTFPLNLTINPGDQIAMDADKAALIYWRAADPGASSHEFNSPLDGESTMPPTFTNPDFDHTFNAVLDATNSFTLGAVTRDKNAGTATVQVQVSNPGQLTGSGSGASVASARAEDQPDRQRTRPGHAHDQGRRQEEEDAEEDRQGQAQPVDHLHAHGRRPQHAAARGEAQEEAPSSKRSSR